MKWRNIPRRARGLYFSFLNRRYDRLWNQMARQNAKDAILTGYTSESEFNRAGEEDAKWLRGFIPQGATVLDFGCGIGRIEKFLAPHCSELHAVDVSSDMIKRAQARNREHSNALFQCIDPAKPLPFSASFFDAVFSLLVLQHVEQEDAFRYLLEFNRILKDGGLCIVQFPNMQSEDYFRDFLRFTGQQRENRSIGRVRLYTAEEVQIKMKRAGFEIIEMRNDAKEIIVISRRAVNAPLLSDLMDFEAQAVIH